MSDLKSLITGAQFADASLRYRIETPLSEGVFMQDDFEDGVKDMKGEGAWGGSRNGVTVSTENPRTGKYSLRMPFRTQNAAEQRFKFDARRQDVWCRYDFFIPANYIHGNFEGSPASNNNKGMFFIWGDDKTQPNNGYSSGIATVFKNEWRPEGDGGSIVEANVSRRIYEGGEVVGRDNWRFGGNNHGLPAEYYGQTRHIRPSDFGRWQEVIVHAVNATPQNGGLGSYEIWIRRDDGSVQKIVNLHELPFQATETDGSPSQGYNYGYLLGASNSGWGEETVFYIDNIKFSTTSLF